MVVGGRELIDTLWNVNFEDKELFWKFAERINRYIMECKFPYRNRYNLSGIRELIDTLWNVNGQIILIPLTICDELIDTLWNVNVETSALPSRMEL